MYPDLWPHAPLVVDLSAVKELQLVQHQQDGVLLGAGLAIQQLIGILRSPTAAAPAAATARAAAAADGTTGQQLEKGGAARRPDDSAVGSTGGAEAGDASTPADAGVRADPAKPAAAPAATGNAVWTAMADHLERIAGKEGLSLLLSQTGWQRLSWISHTKQASMSICCRFLVSKADKVVMQT